jgi:hypothetical protein
VQVHHAKAAERPESVLNGLDTAQGLHTRCEVSDAFLDQSDELCIERWVVHAATGLLLLPAGPCELDPGSAEMTTVLDI